MCIRSLVLATVFVKSIKNCLLQIAYILYSMFIAVALPILLVWFAIDLISQNNEVYNVENTNRI